MISLKTYNKKELGELINSKEFISFSFLPITKHRAISQINNPRAKFDDTLLIIAFDDGKIVGYIGILPDDLFVGNQNIHLGWFSSLFIHPDFRTKKLARQILTKACDEYSGKILITEFTPEAENLYKRMKLFDTLPALEGKAFHYLFNLHGILKNKNAIWKNFSLLLKFFDFSLNTFLFFWNRTLLSKKQDFVAIQQFDDESKKFIDNCKKENLFNRKSSEIEWITKNPWILNGSKPNEKYYFSSYDNNYETVFIKIYTAGTLKILLILSIRNSVAKLLFTFGDGNEIECSEAIYRYIIENNISCFISFDSKINHHLDSRFCIFKKARFRKFFMHKTLSNQLGKDFVFDVSAGDGDAVFT